MGLMELKSNLAIGVGTKQTPQSYTDGHSDVIVTGQKVFAVPPRLNPSNFELSAINRQGIQAFYTFNESFAPETILKSTKDSLQSYYDRALKNTDRLGARNNDRFGFDQPFIIKGIGDRWGPGNIGAVDAGMIRAGAITQASRTAADIVRIGKFLLTPKGVSFIAKQEILQMMNAGGSLTTSTLKSKINQALGKDVLKQDSVPQRFSTGRDIFKSKFAKAGKDGHFKGGGSTVQNWEGSDIRSWRGPESIMLSLPVGAHFVRHKTPVGSPSVKLVNNVGNFLVDAGDGVLSLLDGIQVAWPHISMNPDFRAGGLLTGLGNIAANVGSGMVDLFPNIYHGAKQNLTNLGAAIGDTLSGISLPKMSLGRFPDSLTGLFPGMINLPSIGTPDFSGLKSMLGGLTSAAKSLLGGIKLPSISLPTLPGLPSLPSINLPNLGNPFSGLASALSGININLPKFSGRGGLGLGQIVSTISSALPSIRLKGRFSPGSFHFDMSAFDDFKGSFGDGLKALIDSPGFNLNMVSGVGIPQPGVPLYGRKGASGRYGVDMNKFGSQIGPKGKGGFAGLAGEDKPHLYYTTAKDILDNRGGLTNIYSKESSYEKLVIAGKQEWGASTFNNSFGIGWDSTKEIPIAIQSGFLGPDKVNDNFPLNTRKKAPLNVDITAEQTLKLPNSVVEAKSPNGNRLLKYEMLSYGQLGGKDAVTYGQKNVENFADKTRQIGSYGGAARYVADPEFGMRASDGTTKYKGKLQDGINLHPYGGSTADDFFNDTNIDFVPLKFRDMVNGKWIIFRAILESISDTSSPEYAEERYIGRPDKVYVYQGATRNVNVTFKVMPKSIQELVTLWDKLNFLRGLTYPSIQNNRMISPFFNFTLGDMFDKQPMIFQSLNYAIDTASTWEIKPGLRLPKLIQVSADMRLVENKLPITTGKHYDLDWLDGTKEYGTFHSNPSNPTAFKPDRDKFNSLWEQLSILGLNDDLEAQIEMGEQVLDAFKETVEGLKSSEGFIGSDVPTPFGTLSI